MGQQLVEGEPCWHDVLLLHLPQACLQRGSMREQIEPSMTEADCCHPCLPAQEQDLIRLKRDAKTKNGFYVEPEAKMAFVIRIRGINDMHPKVSCRRQQCIVCPCCIQSNAEQHPAACTGIVTSQAES